MDLFLKKTRVQLWTANKSAHSRGLWCYHMGLYCSCTIIAVLLLLLLHLINTELVLYWRFSLLFELSHAHVPGHIWGQHSQSSFIPCLFSYKCYSLHSDKTTCKYVWCYMLWLMDVLNEQPEKLVILHSVSFENTHFLLSKVTFK